MYGLFRSRFQTTTERASFAAVPVRSPARPRTVARCSIHTLTMSYRFACITTSRAACDSRHEAGRTQDTPKTHPRRSQDAAKTKPRHTQDTPKAHPRHTQDAPKTHPRHTQYAPTTHPRHGWLTGLCGPVGHHFSVFESII
jgi:TPP-dependent indolepyruvate ferredoxin oxidoreductase alpha subunit